MEYYSQLLELSKKEYLAKNYTKSLEYLSEVKTFAQNNGQIDLQMKALNNMAIVYNGILDYTKTIECLLEGYSLALKKGDKELEMIFLNNIGSLYHEDNQIEKAKKYMEKAYALAIGEKDSSMIGLCAGNLGLFANEMGDLDLAKKYLDVAIPILAVFEKDTGVLVNVEYYHANNLFLRGHYNEVESLLLKTIPEIPDKYNNHKADYLLLLSKVYQKKHEIGKAIQYAQKSLEQNSSLAKSAQIYMQLADLYMENSAPLLAVQYKDSVIYVKDSLVMLDKQAQMLNNLIRVELLTSEKELAESKAKQKEDRTLFLVISMSILVFLLIFFWIFRFRYIKNKQQKVLELEKEKNGKLLLEQQLKEQEALALFEQEKLNSERNEKLLLQQKLVEQETLALLEQERLTNENRQLAAKVLIQSNRNELIEEIIQSLSKIPARSEDSQLQLVIQQLKTQLKKTEQWDNFLAYFEQVSPSFLSSLKEKHPELTIGDIRYLSYMFLNFSTKEIASLLNMSLDSCKKKRQRLANKIGVETADLYPYLLSIV